jgi:hypothetical protein
MQVDDVILKSAAFIGFPTERGFAAVGTGFFATLQQGEHDFVYFITAAHVTWPGRKRERQPPDTTIHIRTNLRAGGSKVEPTKVKDEWVFHEDRQVDVCALPLGLHNTTAAEEIDDISFLALPSISVPFLVGLDRNKTPRLGDEVFITGAFVGRIGEHKNIPVVRIGNIAALPQEPLEFASPRRPAYLLETRSLGGISGSPVFLNYSHPANRGRPHFFQATEVNATDPTKTRPKTIVPYGLLGMMLGSHSGQYAEDFVSENDTDILPPKDADFNAGIAVAMSVVDIIEFLENNSMLKQKRDGAISEREKAVG